MKTLEFKQSLSVFTTQETMAEELRVLEARQPHKRSHSKSLPSKVKRDRSFKFDDNVIDLT